MKKLIAINHHRSPRKIGLIATAAILSLLMVMPAVHASPFGFGNVFAGVGAGKINVYTPTGTLIQTLDTTSGSTEQTGMCFDSTGHLYTTDWTAGNMAKFDNTGALVTFPWAGPFSTNPESCVLDNAGNVYTGEVGGAVMIRKWTQAGAPLATYSAAPEVRGLNWIDLASDQCTIHYTSEGPSIKRFNVCTNTQLSDFTTGLSAPCFALRIRPNGEVMVACSSQVYRLSSTGTTIQTYTAASVGELSTFFALNLDPDGTSFWTAGYSTGHVYRINISTGALITTFTAPPNAISTAGLAIFGEITVGCEPNCPHGVPEFSLTTPLIASLAMLALIPVRKLTARRRTPV